MRSCTASEIDPVDLNQTAATARRAGYHGAGETAPETRDGWRSARRSRRALSAMWRRKLPGRGTRLPGPGADAGSPGGWSPYARRAQRDRRLPDLASPALCARLDRPGVAAPLGRDRLDAAPTLPLRPRMRPQRRPDPVRRRPAQPGAAAHRDGDARPAAALSAGHPLR